MHVYTADRTENLYIIVTNIPVAVSELGKTNTRSGAEDDVVHVPVCCLELHPSRPSASGIIALDLRPALQESIDRYCSLAGCH